MPFPVTLSGRASGSRALLHRAGRVHVTGGSKQGGTGPWEGTRSSQGHTEEGPGRLQLAQARAQRAEAPTLHRDILKPSGWTFFIFIKA